MRSMQNSLVIMGHLLRRDWYVLKRTFLSLLMQNLTWPIRSTLVYSFLMVPMGVSSSYGVFYLSGVVGTVAFFRLYHNSYDLLSDLNGDCRIDYELTLPIPYWIVFVRYAVRYAVQTFFLALPIFPMGALLLLGRASFLHFSLLKFLLILGASNLFWGVYALWAAIVVKNSNGLTSLWYRVLHTSWIFGCFFFSWQLLFELYPTLAYISLCNPVVYVMEGVRNAIQGPTGSISFIYSLLALLGMSGIILRYAIWRLAKRLDVVQ